MGKTLNKKKTIKNFQAKGFQEYQNKSDDHIWLEFWHNGKLTLQRTKFSHGSKKDIDDYLIGAIAKQVAMPKPFLIEFAKCEKSQEDYVQLLKDNGKL